MRQTPYMVADVKAQAVDARFSADLALPVFERLLQTLEAENEQVSCRQPVDYRQFAQRKSQCLLEISRLGPTIAGLPPSPALTASVQAVIRTLEQNKAILEVQVKAAQRISDVIANSIQEGQSDGTYSHLAWRYHEE